MDEIRFENKYTRTPELFREYCGYYTFRSPVRIVLSIVAIFVVAISVLLLALRFIFPEVLENVGFAYVPSMLVLWLLVLFLPIIRYRSAVKNAIKQDRELNGGELMSVCVTVYDSEFKFESSSGSNITLEYGDIKRVVQSKGLVWVVTKARIAYILKKDSFTVGDTDSFVAFIKQKIAK